MFAIFGSRYWAKRGARMRRRDRRRGWNWAAGALLAGEDPAKVEHYAQEAVDFDHDTDFDEGVFDAVKAWREKMGETST